MLRMIPRHPKRISATELTRCLNDLGYTVNRRTVERDLRMFEAVFGLVSDDRSRPYGWQWPRESAGISIAAMDDNEALMLSLAEPIADTLLPPTARDALRPFFGEAQRRLNGHLGSRSLKAWKGKVLSIPASQALLPASIGDGIQEAIATALLHDQWIRIRYQQLGSRSTVELDVGLLGLVARGSAQYLVCQFRSQNGERTIALSRIEQANILDERFQYPRGFDLAKYVGSGKLGFGASRTERIRLRLYGKVGKQLLETPLAADQVVVEDAPAYLTVEVTVPVTPDLRRWVLSLGEDIEVLYPASLRKRIVQSINRASDRYD